ncbi:MAG: FG-GAP-like repeat-containing protein [Candidatus Krumholzibacteriia bacterium]
MHSRTRAFGHAGAVAFLLTLLGMSAEQPVAADKIAIVYEEIGAQAGASNTWDGYGPGAGVAAEDFDNDGDPDLVLLNGVGASSRMFENVGDTEGTGYPSFVEITEMAGLVDLGNTKSAVFADYDNDGLEDLFFCNYDETVDDRPEFPGFVSCICLFKGNGDGTFTDVTAQAGLLITGIAAYGVSIADVDNDGWVDLFLSNRGGRGQMPNGDYNLLFRNRGDGTFEDVSSSSGIADARSMTFQGGFFDYDSDGDQDLYICSDKGTGNLLYRNDGNSTFTNVSAESGADVHMDGLCVAVGDYDNDLDLDVFITNTPMQGSGRHAGHALLRNDGSGTFTEVAGAAGVLGSGRVGWGAIWLDADNDGHLDLYVASFGPDKRNQLFRNLGNSTFQDIASAAGCENAFDGFGLAQADFDRDGKPDFVVANQRAESGLFLHTGTASGWIRFRLIGIDSNRDAIGARLRLYAQGSVQVREVICGDSYLSHSEKEIAFGLGGLAPDSVQIWWPSGRHQTIDGIEPNAHYRIIEGAGIQTQTALMAHQAEQGINRVTLSWETVQWPADEGFRVKRTYIGGGGPEVVQLADIPDQGRWHEFADDVSEVVAGTYRYSVFVTDAGDAESLLFESQDLDIVPTPVELEGFEAAVTGSGVELSWRLSRPAVRELRGVHVQRATASQGPYEVRTSTALTPAPAMRFVDLDVENGEYWYRLILDGRDGSQSVTSAIGVPVRGAADLRTALLPPVEPLDGGPVRLGFSVGRSGPVELRVFDARGRLLRTLVREARVAGAYWLTWNRRDEAGRRVGRGLYFLHLRAGRTSDARKLLLLRR